MNRKKSLLTISMTVAIATLVVTAVIYAATVIDETGITTNSLTADKIGIGTTLGSAESWKLKVAGNMTLENSASGYRYSYIANSQSGLFTGVEMSGGGGLVPGSTAFAGVIGLQKAYPLQFYTNNSVRMTILADGKVGIGTRAPQKELDVSGTIHSNFYEAEYNGNFSSAGPTVYLQRSRGAKDSPQVVSDNDVLGIFGWMGYTGTSWEPSARIYGKVDSSAGNGKIVFQTTGNGNDCQGNCNRMTIRGNGNVGVNTEEPKATLHVDGSVYFEGGTGDISGNNEIQNSDRNDYLIPYLKGTKELTVAQMATADINGDGKVSYDDEYIMTKLSGTGVDTSSYESAKKSAIQKVNALYGAKSESEFYVGGTLILKDSDGSGCTAMTCNDGSCTFYVSACP